MPEPEAGRPELRVEALDCCLSGTPGVWTASWRIENTGTHAVEIISAWLPHDKFAGGRRIFDAPLRLSSGESTYLELPVACHEPPGSVVENAFLILQQVWQDQTWRALARHVVVVDPSGVPRHQCQVVTTQPVGFSPPGGTKRSQTE